MYKIETHLHTKYSSACGRLDEKQIVSGYLEAGYAGVVVTDHFCRSSFRNFLHQDIADAADAMKRYLEGYFRVKEEGERSGLRVYKGMELRFDCNLNDYLLYGFEDDLLLDIDGVFAGGLEQFVEKSRAAGVLLIQAHPYREICQVVDHRYLDGVEVLNLHPGQKSRNELAIEYARRWPELIRTSGSDCHEMHHLGRGGILADYLPKDEKELVQLLRSGKYQLIGG